MVNPFSTNLTIDSETTPSLLLPEEEFAPPEASETEVKVQEEATCCDGACLINWKPLKASVA